MVIVGSVIGGRVMVTGGSVVVDGSVTSVVVGSVVGGAVVVASVVVVVSSTVVRLVGGSVVVVVGASVVLATSV
jgi:hypothetical protein